MRKTSIFWQKPWTNPLQNVNFFDFARTSRFGSKKHFSLSKIKKYFFLAFLAKKKHIRKKGRFFGKNHGLTLCKMSIFFTLLEFHFSGLKSILYYLELKKCFFLAFLAKKKHIRKKGRFFGKNHGLTLCKMSIFLTLLEFHFSGLKSILYYPELKKCFFLAFLAKRKHIRKKSIFW